MYECAAEFARSLILEANSKDEEIRRLEAEIRELQEQAEELRFNPNHDPKNGRFTSGNGVDILGESGIIKINKAKNIDIFNDDDLKPDDPTTTEILNELSKSAVGREITELISELPEAVVLKQGSVPELRGEERFGKIKIYVNQCRNVQWIARTIIHEYTHYRYGIGGSQWAECICIAQELKHARNRDYLTIAEKRLIVKAVKNDSDYSKLSWKKGGFVNGRRKNYRQTSQRRKSSL